MSRALRRRLLAVAVTAATGLTILAGCADPPSPTTPAHRAVMGWLVRDGQACGATAQEVREQAAALVDRGLTELGFTTLYLGCPGTSLRSDVGLRRDLAAEGLRLEVRAQGQWPLTEVISTRMPRAAAFRTAVTRRLMAAGPLLYSGPVAEMTDEVLADVANREIIELSLDDRRAPGAAIDGDPDLWSRAIGDQGLLVSLTNGGTGEAERSVPIAALNLAGADSVPAHDVWTGTRLVSADGLLTVRLAASDSALLRIG